MDIDVLTEERMQKALEAMESKLINVRAGRANPSMLNGIMVSYYGAPTPINTLANITVPEARQLFIKPFDRSAVKDIEKAINEANLGVSPTNNGEMVIITIPELTEDKRKEYVKQAKSIAEETKVAIRNAREEARNAIKKEDLSEDDEELYLNEIQEMTDKYNTMIDEKLKEKENELMVI